MAMKSLLHASFLFVSLIIATNSEEIIVTTKYGNIAGNYTGGMKRGISEFLGVPYAKPPTGELRFKDPKEVESWIGTKEAYQFSKNCIQGRGSEEDDEDCLYLNMWIPRSLGKKTDLSDELPLPVFVFVHGGNFEINSDLNIKGNLLAEHGGVIVITFNYRLHVFGFLTTENPESGGNYGVMDQVMVLRWVNENIKYFGGDPGNVTLGGLSAGGRAVGAHILSPKSRGLFHKAVSMSGALLAYELCFVGLNPMRDQVNLSKRLGELAECSIEDTDVMLQCLRDLSQERLYQVYKQLQAEKGPMRGNLAFIVDGKFLPDEPRKLYESGQYTKVPYLIGYTQDEFADFALGMFPGYVFDGPNITAGMTAPNIAFLLGLKFTEDQINAMFPVIELEYIPDYIGSLEIMKGVLQFGTDTFVVPAVNVMNYHSKSAPVFAYMNTHKPSFSRIADKPYMGATHGEDKEFIFGTVLERTDASKEEKELSRQIIDMWTNFMKTGVPTSTMTNVNWMLYTAEDPCFLRITTNMTSQSLDSNLAPHSVKLWNDVIPSIIEKDCPPTIRLANGAKVITGSLMNGLLACTLAACLFVHCIFA